jgi:tetratricopeptide (TPR) repeat protein
MEQRIARAEKRLAGAKGATRVDALETLAALEAMRGNGDRALELLAEIDAVAAPTDAGREARLSHIRGTALFQQNDGVASAAAHQRALSLFRELGEQENVAQSLLGYGRAARLQGDHRIALACYEEAESVFRRLRRAVDAGRVVLAIGNIHYDAMRLDEADGRYQQGVRIFQRIRDAFGVAICLTARADVARARGQDAAELAFRVKALPALRRAGRERTRAECARALGDLHLRNGRTAAAVRALREAARAFRKIGWEDDAIRCDVRAGNAMPRKRRQR